MRWVLEFDGYFSSDISTYISLASISTSVQLVNVPINGGVSTPGKNNNEVALDIEMAISMAPGLSHIYVYDAPITTLHFSCLLSKMAENLSVKQFSSSWTGGNDPASESIFKEMATHGQTFFNCSGDFGAYLSSEPTPFPAGSPNVTVVGGTTLTTGTGGSYASEVVWNWLTQFGILFDGIASSGGINADEPIPTYQQGISMSGNQGSTSFRNIPDVAMVADDVLAIFHDTNGVQVGQYTGGTSCAAPLWAGFMALVNQQAAANSQPPVGFLNPTLYSIAKGAGYSLAFNDVTVGNNEWSGSPTKFSAAAGYDLCTGWGSPTGANLINYLLSPDGGLWNATPPISGAPAGWVRSPWFGDFNITSDPWIYHNQHLWLYTWGHDESNVVFYDDDMSMFWWTSSTEYPYVYRFDDSSWLWYDVVHSTSTQRFFYNFTTSLWETWD